MSKFITMTFLFLFAGASQATPNSGTIKSVLEAQPACQNFVRYDDKNLYLGFGAYKIGFEEPRFPIPAKFRVAPLNGLEAFELATKDAAIDIATEGNTAFVLTYSSIEEWNLETRTRVAEYATYAIGGIRAYKEHAQAMARYNDKLIIAHGRLGISIFNMKTKRLVNQFRLVQHQLPLESMATGVTVQSNRAFVVMDNFNVTSPGDGVKIFRGVIVVNMDSESVQNEVDGMELGADAVVSDANNLVVSMAGDPILTYDLAAITGKSIPSPTARVRSYPVDGHPIGFAMLDDKYYYTCYSKAPTPPGHGGVYSKVPMALDRKLLR